MVLWMRGQTVLKFGLEARRYDGDLDEQRTLLLSFE